MKKDDYYFELEYTLWEKIYYPCYRFINRFNPKDRYRDVKYFIQRGKRGYDDTTWWNVNNHLYLILPPLLRKLAKDGWGVPSSLDIIETNTQFNARAKEWKQQLNKAADDIEACYKHEQKDFPRTKKARDKYFKDGLDSAKQTKEGMKFVAEHFFDLWD